MRLPRRLLFLAALGGAAAWYGRAVFRFRDPARAVQPGAGAVLSPVDGLVAFVRRIEGGRVWAGSPPVRSLTGLDTGEGWLLGLTVGPLAVQYVYAPVDGPARTLRLDGERAKVSLRGVATTARFWTGRPSDPLGTPGVSGNERHTTALSIGGGEVGITLMARASRLRAVSYARPGGDLRAGHKLALLDGGGLVLLTLPGAAVPQVSVGDRVTGAETVVAQFSRREPTASAPRPA